MARVLEVVVAFLHAINKKGNDFLKTIHIHHRGRMQIRFLA